MRTARLPNIRASVSTKCQHQVGPCTVRSKLNKFEHVGVGGGGCEVQCILSNGHIVVSVSIDIHDWRHYLLATSWGSNSTANIHLKNIFDNRSSGSAILSYENGFAKFCLWKTVVTDKRRNLLDISPQLEHSSIFRTISLCMHSPTRGIVRLSLNIAPSISLFISAWTKHHLLSSLITAPSIGLFVSTWSQLHLSDCSSLLDHSSIYQCSSMHEHSSPNGLVVFACTAPPTGQFASAWTQPHLSGCSSLHAQPHLLDSSSQLEHSSSRVVTFLL